MKKLIVTALLAVSVAAGGLGIGAGTASAQIEPGRYKQQVLLYGVIPYPEQNVRVVGNTLYADFYGGVGPKNLYVQHIRQTKRGGVVSFTGNPAEEWYSRVEYSKSKHGYYGTIYRLGGIPLGNYTLRKVG